MAPNEDFTIFKYQLFEEKKEYPFDEKFKLFFELNQNAYLKLRENKKSMILLVIFRRLFEEISISGIFKNKSSSKLNENRRYLDSIDSFQYDRNNIFSKEEIGYLQHFLCKNKKIVSSLIAKNIVEQLKKEDQEKINIPVKNNAIINPKEILKLNKITQLDESYYLNFLKISLFLCAVYRVIIKEDGRLEILNEKIDQYYIFYNRSFIGLSELGVGELKIVDNFKAYVKYHYQDKKDVELKTEGNVEYDSKAQTLFIKNLKDSNDCSDIYKKDGPIESYFTIKKFSQESFKTEDNENILLGINTSINREKKFPYATAIILVKRDYYEKNYSKYPFEKLKGDRKDENLPYDIYYYLFHQSISLQESLEQNVSDAANYIKIEDKSKIPYASESKQLSKLAGKYTGISFVETQKLGENIGDVKLIVSELEILPTGRVSLCLENSGDFENNKSNVTRDGFIKSIVMTKHNFGKLIITLSHDFRAHTNNLTLFLEFDLVSKIIYGAYAGESLITQKPVASTVFFTTKEKINLNPEIISLFINGKINEKAINILTEFNLAKNFFLDDDNQQFSNYNAIAFLKKHFYPQVAKKELLQPEEKFQFEVFLSIPLTFVDSKEQFLKNRKIALSIREILYNIFGIEKEKIYAACIFDEEKIKNWKNEGVQNIEEKIYAEYLKRNQSKTEHYDKVRGKLDTSKRIILIFPERLDMCMTRISSSIIELGYLIGKGRDFVVFHDVKEEKTLPNNLKLLYDDRMFDFESFNQEILVKEFNKDRIELVRRYLNI